MLATSEPNPTPDLSVWIGNTESTYGAVSSQVVAAVHATLDGQGDAPIAGDEMPALWHWYAFPPTASMEELGADGHPKLGGFLPPVPLERRMWAAGKLQFYAPLHVGEALTKKSQITAIKEIDGAAGPMVFVTVQHDIHSAKGLCVSETQDIVYLRIAPEFTPPPKREPPRENLVVQRGILVSEALLFRYSAITFNAHRIHYDQPYARDVERYPGLVVHGPLQANLLIAAATKWKGRAPSQFQFRGVHPMFHQDDVQLLATKGDDGALTLCTAVKDSHQGMTATAIWEET